MRTGFLWALLFLVDTAHGQTFQLLEGSIAGKYPVKMLLCRDGNALTGSYYYLKSGELIALEGHLRSATDADFFEFVDPIVSTGQFYGKLTDEGFDGKWLNLETRKELSALLKTSYEPHDEFFKGEVDISFVEQPGQLSGFSLPVFRYEGTYTLQKKLGEIFSFKRLTGETWHEVEQKFATEDFPYGIVGMHGAVTCNEGFVLSVLLSLEGRGAHGSYWDERINVHLRDARILKIGDLLDMNAVGPLVQYCRAVMTERVIEKMPDIEADGLDVESLVHGDLFRVEDLSNFSVLADHGIAFCAKWEFPYYAKVHEPDRVIVFSFRDLSPYLRPGSLLESFY